MVSCCWNHFYPNALRMAKTLWSFGHSECNRVKENMHCNSDEIGSYGEIIAPDVGSN